jgi:hypothetical protein
MAQAASYKSHTGYMHTRQLAAEILDAAIEGFELRKVRIDDQIAQVRQLQNGDQPVAAGTSEPQKPPRRKMSAATRKRMGEAQRKRWAPKSVVETRKVKILEGAETLGDIPPRAAERLWKTLRVKSRIVDAVTLGGFADHQDPQPQTRTGLAEAH